MVQLNPVSEQRLRECDPKLQLIVRRVAVKIPLLVICGFRGKEDQDKAFSDGKSKLKWPQSKHNRMPSDAIDIATIPLDFSDEKSFAYLAGYMMATAHDLGIKLRWGGDWNSNGKTKDERFADLVHYELLSDSEVVSS